MLIQNRAPRLKPLGGPVMRVRRDHALATELRGCFLFGGSAGVGVDLVTGIVGDAGGETAPVIGEDGPGVDTGSSSQYVSFAHDPAYNILGHLSVGWRGRRNTATDDIIASKSYWGASGAGEYTPWDVQVIPGGNIYFVRSRQGVYQFRAWMGSAGFVPTSRMVSLSVSQGDAVETAPRFFVDGVEDATPASMYGGAANGNAFGNSDPIIFNGYKGVSNFGDHHHSLLLLAATTWDTAQHIAFDDDTYGILEDAPLYHFLGGGGTLPPISAVSDLTLAPITGSATAALAVAGTSAATLAAVAGEFLAAVALAGVSGQDVDAITGTTTAAVSLAAGSTASLSAIAGTMAGTLSLAGASVATLVFTGTMLGAVELAAASVLTLGPITGTMLGQNPYVPFAVPLSRIVTLPARLWAATLASRGAPIVLPARNRTVTLPPERS